MWLTTRPPNDLTAQTTKPPMTLIAITPVVERSLGPIALAAGLGMIAGFTVQ